MSIEHWIVIFEARAHGPSLPPTPPFRLRWAVVGARASATAAGSLASVAGAVGHARNVSAASPPVVLPGLGGILPSSAAVVVEQHRQRWGDGSPVAWEGPAIVSCAAPWAGRWLTVDEAMAMLKARRAA